jgi:hypothetical protein
LEWQGARVLSSSAKSYKELIRYRRLPGEELLSHFGRRVVGLGLLRLAARLAGRRGFVFVLLVRARLALLLLRGRRRCFLGSGCFRGSRRRFLGRRFARFLGRGRRLKIVAARRFLLALVLVVVLCLVVLVLVVVVITLVARSFAA